ncbi:MAG: hypothetical protein LBD27_04205 [Tannerella sp.]|jgi:hypothetical protein|nr:hypothetical protein [Tannerella sp.]
MATYVETKREAVGFEPPQAAPSLAGDSAFDVPANMGQMQAGGHIVNFDKPLEAPTNRQANLKFILETKWDEEYASDRKAARKHVVRLREYLLAGDANKTAHFLAHHPAADWLNRVFLDSAEISALTDVLRKTSSDCRAAVAFAAGKEMERLVNFKELLEQLLKELSHDGEQL